MIDFEFHNPTKIFFGKKSICNITQNISNTHKLLVLVDPQVLILNQNLTNDLNEILSNYKYLIFDKIKPNSEYNSLLEAIALAKINKITYILAVGGGSIIDGAKFVACAINYPNYLEPWQLLLSTGYSFINNIIPLSVILTISAAGSEMNPYCVISDKTQQRKIACYKPIIYPQYTILDPEYSFTLSNYQSSLGIIDSFVHVLEQYLVANNNSLIQLGFAETILRTLISQAYIVTENFNNYEARANIMLASTLALNGLIECSINSDWTIHWISHELTALYGLSHAEAIIVLVKPVLQYTKTIKQQQLIRFGREVWGLSEVDSDILVESAINLTIDFFKKLGVKTTLKEHGINKINNSDAITIIKNIYEFTQGESLGENKQLDHLDIQNIINLVI